MQYRLAKDIYPKIALLKAAYQFTEIAYIFIEQDEKAYIIDFVPKVEQDEVSVQDFKNELLFQALRCEISEETKQIRTLIASRAMASTIIQKPTVPQPINRSFSSSEILKDWFENEGN